MLANLTICFIRLLGGVQIYWFYAEPAKIEIGKFITYKNMKIASSISSTEVHSVRSDVECSLRLLSKDDICVASYNTVTGTCMLYTSGCSPSFKVSSTGILLIRRDLSGLIQDNEDCSYFKNINAPSGVYTIQPYGISTGMSVYCDMNTDSGGWIVFQKRYDGSVDFYETWNQYKNGFGSLSGELWLGLIQDNEDCSYYKNTNAPNAVYTIQPEGVSTGMSVYCDMNTDNGGWILIQNRFDGFVNFYQTWNQYKNGFGSLSGEFWLGNDNLHTLTYTNKYMLRVDLTDNIGNQRYAEYYIFRVSDEADKYRLIIGEYYGDAGDAMYYNNNQIFHTKDQDSTVGFNGRVCSLDRYAGFWFDECTLANLNGRWLPGIDSWESNYWNKWHDTVGLSKISMKIRRK